MDPNPYQSPKSGEQPNKPTGKRGLFWASMFVTLPLAVFSALFSACFGAMAVAQDHLGSVLVNGAIAVASGIAAFRLFRSWWRTLK